MRAGGNQALRRDKDGLPENELHLIASCRY